MILEVLHPAAMTLVPPKARKARLAHVAMRTAVEVPEVPADALRPWHAPDAACGRWPHLLRVEGRPGPWSPATCIGEGALTRDGLRAALETDGGDGFDLRGTPLCAYGDLGDRQAVQPRSPSTRGEAIDPAAARAVIEDGRERASRIVRGHVAGAYLVAGDRVLVRAVPYAIGYARDRFDLRVGTANDAVRLWDASHFAAGHEDLDAVLSAVSATLHGSERKAWTSMGEALAPGIGARIALDSHPAIVRRLLARAAAELAHAGGPASAVEEARAEADALAPLELAGMTGTCGWDDPAEALRILGRAADVAARTFPGPSRERVQAATIARVVVEALLPRVPVPGHLDDDARALSGLGPG